MKVNKERSGCRDVFHAFLVENARYAGAFEIPHIKGTKYVPNKVIAFSKCMRTKDYDQWVHFYEDDYLFERLWNNPRKYLPILKKFKGVILPDFSLYRDMPLAMQIWNIYRSRAIGTWLEYNSIEIIPNIRYGDERTFDVCCDGIPQGTVVAIGSVGCIRNKQNRRYFIEGAVHSLAKIKPAALIVCGIIPPELMEFCKTQNITITSFDGETKLFFAKEVV